MLKISYVRYILMFILLVLLQVVVLNSISLLRYAIPLIYIYFILKLPIGIGRNSILLLGFTLGMIVDVFSNTLGVNAAAATLIAFIREPIMGMFFMLDEHEDEEPGAATLGMTTFMKYASVLVFIHILVLSILESFSFLNIKMLCLRVLFSSCLSILLILAFERLGFTKKNNTSWKKI